MLLSKQKPFEEILGYLEGESRVFLLGCDGCAQASGTGGPVQVAEMKEKLEAAGKTVTGTDVVDFLCEKALIKSRLAPRTADDHEAGLDPGDDLRRRRPGDGGLGQQAVPPRLRYAEPRRQPRGVAGQRAVHGVRRVRAGVDRRHMPAHRLHKGLLSGQCGGASKGKCELSPEKDCGWELIYYRLKALGRLDKLKELRSAEELGQDGTRRQHDGDVALCPGKASQRRRRTAE